jgi:DNA-binding NarL/FixJ family response regulator
MNENPSNDNPVTILIADDQKLIRGGFRMLLDSYEDMKVVGEVSNGEEAVQLARDLKPDVVLMDIRMPIMDGIEATDRIVGNPYCPDTHVLILTTFDIDRYVYDALRSGASGFLLKDAESDELVNAIRVIAAGDALLAPSITRRLISEFAKAGAKQEMDDMRLGELTEREREVLTFIARGLSNEEIAEELYISPTTVKTHVGRIMSKLDLHDRAQLVILAYETGLVTPGS